MESKENLCPVCQNAELEPGDNYCKICGEAIAQKEMEVEKSGVNTEEWLLTCEDKLRYMMLGRMECDCKYYLGYGDRYPRCLWAGTEEKQIKYMKLLWNSFSEGNKPEWLSWEEIAEYELKMCQQA